MSIGVHTWLNVACYVSVALVAFGAANRMSKQTECTIIVSFATVGAGAIAWAIGAFLPNEWEQAFDTLFVGGVLALLIGTRRQTIWIKPEWMPRMSISVSAVTWIAFFCTVA